MAFTIAFSLIVNLMRHDDVRVEKIGEHRHEEHDTKRMIENSSKYIVSSCVIFILLPLFGRVKKIETL